MRRFLLVVLAIVGGANEAQAETLYGLTADQRVITFDSSSPTNILTGVSVQGVLQNEQILGIDVRPATGELFGVGSFNNLYTLDPVTGQATLRGAGNFVPGLNGAWFGFDFNPTIDRIRNVSDANQNLVLNPDAGTSTGVTDLFYPAGDPNAGVDPTVAHSAYTNNFSGSTTTQLYGIDVNLDILVTQANSAGTLGTVGSLNVEVASAGGFDISGTSGRAFAALQREGSAISELWEVDLATGTATSLGEIAGGVVVNGLSAVPEPSALAIVALGALPLVRRRGAR
jgi:hypothetical protein